MGGSPVERVQLAPGLSISRVVTGLWQIADMERGGRPVDPVATAAAMRPYVDAGLTTFDMADHYGSAEVVCGTYRASAGAGEVQLLTKWVPPPGTSRPEDARAAVEQALQRLRSDRIDLLQFHAWSFADPSWLDCLAHLQELKREGLVGALGVTNFDTAHLRVALHTGIDIVSNQVSYSLLDSRARGDMAELCAEHGVGILAFGTLAGGFLTERWLGRPEPEAGALRTWSEMKYKRFIDVTCEWDAFQRLLGAVKRIADRRGASMANVAGRAILDRPSVAGIVVGARLGRSEHIADSLRTCVLELGDQDREELDAAVGALRRVPGDCGDEYRRAPFLTASGDLSHHLVEMPAPYPVRVGADGRSRVLSGTVWEGLAGFGRAVREGDRILVSGTTATHGDRAVGGTDPAAQAHVCIDKIEGALLSLGARLEDVVRTRVYIRRAEDWEAVSRAHGARFGHVRPANTLVQAGIIGEEYLVEIEAEAVVARPRTDPGG
ncbi:MAG TPA: aldo/keto reductase [Longimicrobiales bacterium]|nr:aldo/keto reductase [Longimicrobiales bacterium]